MRARPRIYSRLQACFVAVALLLAQVAMAAQACVSPGVAPALILVVAPSEPCEGMSANACLAQLLHGDQAVDPAAGFTLAEPELCTFAAVSPPLWERLSSPRVTFSAPFGPPARVRFSRLLI